MIGARRYSANFELEGHLVAHIKFLRLLDAHFDRYTVVVLLFRDGNEEIGSRPAQWRFRR
jgi:hypothetical protein